MKPRCKVEPVDKDGGRSVNRGTTYPAEVIVTRLEGFEGEVLLQQASGQSYQVQGITGFDVVVPPGVSRTHYRCYMPEWLELDRTSRMIVNAVAKVPDSRGVVRHLVSLMDGRITMSMEGGLLKVSHTAGELSGRAGTTFEVPVKIGRSPRLPHAVRLELVVPPHLEDLVTASPIDVAADQTEAVLRISTAAEAQFEGEYSFTVRGTAFPDPALPVISETTVLIDFEMPEPQ
jgi:hypothetical protein